MKRIPEARRVLIFLLGSLGDTLVALPALRLIARRFPDADRRVLTDFGLNEKAAPMSALLDKTGLVNGYFRFPAPKKHVGRLGPLFHLSREIRAWQPDLAVYLHEQRGRRIALRDAMLFRLCGINRTVGLPLTAASQRILFDAASGRHEHRAEYLARSLAPLGDALLADPASWSLSLQPAERHRAGEFLAPLRRTAGIVAMSIGTKADVNDWGDPHWSGLLGALGAALPGWGLVAIGARVERERTATLLSHWRGASQNLCGDLSVRESAALLEQARIFIGHDSGPMHLAASVGTPCAAVFSARNLPGRWFPYGAQHKIFYNQTACYGCQLLICTEHRKKCIDSISVGEVAAGVLAILSANAANPLHQRSG